VRARPGTSASPRRRRKIQGRPRPGVWDNRDFPGARTSVGVPQGPPPKTRRSPRPIDPRRRREADYGAAVVRRDDTTKSSAAQVPLSDSRTTGRKPRTKRTSGASRVGLGRLRQGFRLQPCRKSRIAPGEEWYAPSERRRETLRGRSRRAWRGRLPCPDPGVEQGGRAADTPKRPRTRACDGPHPPALWDLGRGGRAADHLAPRGVYPQGVLPTQQQVSALPRAERESEVDRKRRESWVSVPTIRNRSPTSDRSASGRTLVNRGTLSADHDT
jgi:hypothetical protein